MFDIHNYAGFVSAIILFQLAPGPGTLAILNSVTRCGKRAGMWAVLGTLAGDLVYMLAAVSGLAALLATSPKLFYILQWAGIVYLCRLGWNMLRTPINDKTREAASVEKVGHHFRQAFAVGLTNPKVVMFFMAFFPVFMTSETKPVTLGVMMAHVSLLCLMYQSVLVLVGDALACRLSRIRKLRLIATRLAGITLIGFGFKLAFKNR